MLDLDQYLMVKQHVLIEGRTTFDNTDGCSKQYRCVAALHLLSVFCDNKNVCIDRVVVAPGNVKDLVDVFNACDKQHMKRYMKRINNPHEGDKDINIKPYLIYILKSLAC